VYEKLMGQKSHKLLKQDWIVTNKINAQSEIGIWSLWLNIDSA
jgi:hypothetical protein